MRKVFHFDSSADPYVADAAVLCCFDHRISTAVRKFLKKQRIEHADMIVGLQVVDDPFGRRSRQFGWRNRTARADG